MVSLTELPVITQDKYFILFLSIRLRNFSRTVVYYDKEIAKKLNRFMSISVLSIFAAAHRAVN